MGSTNLTLKPNPGRPKNSHAGIDKDGNKVYRMPTSPRNWDDVNIPPPKRKGDVVKIHVDMYLKTRHCKIYERGGKVAFAKSKGLEFGTELEFEKLFKTY